VKLSVNWLRELVDLPDSVDEICERLTLLGLEVEDVEEFRLDYPKCVVAEVLVAEQHPDADRLRVCKVNTGKEELDIVCGAPNARAGIKVALAQVGAVLPGGLKIKKGKIRGQVSMGMICSESELGLGAGADGIIELDGDAVVGTLLDDLFAIRDTIIEIEVTPNRPDWLSHVGVARELAAWYGKPMRMPGVSAEVEAVAEDEGWSIRIDDPSACTRFRGRLIDGVKVGPSPRHIRQRLIALGQRPINCVVDASNYVLHELGHPNHCFDRDKLAGKQIILRRATEGEKFTTLDDTERELNAGHLLVADADGGIALAGIMGGANSEVEDSSTSLLLEVAVFDPQVVRKGRRAVGLNTDASYRFERGVDFEAVDLVSRRLCDLILESAGGTARPVAIEATGSAPPAVKPIAVRASQVRRLVGAEIGSAEMIRILEGLQVPVRSIDGGVEVTSPTFRHDLLAEVDVIEEIARLHGFDRLPEETRAPMVAPAVRTESERFSRTLRDALANRGFHEVLGSSFMPDDEPDQLALDATDRRRQTLAVLNPVVQGEGTLKSSALGEMARIVERNRRRGHTGPVRLFQIARSFIAEPDAALPHEPRQLVLAWSGPVRNLHFDDPEREVDLYDAIGEMDGLMAQLGLDVRRSAADPGAPWRPGSVVEFTCGDESLGQVGEIAPAVRRTLDVEPPVLLAEFDFDSLLAARSKVSGWAPFSAYPPVRRDLSLVVPKGVSWVDVRGVVAEVAGDILESCELFDVFEGGDLPEGSVALGVRLSLRSAKSTLKDARVDRMVAKLLDDLQSAHAITLRAG
jgi:phenylalanyl-tRNA synthetase beta chain